MRKPKPPIWIPEVDGQGHQVPNDLIRAAENIFDNVLHRPGPQRGDQSRTAEIIEESVRRASEHVRRYRFIDIRNWSAYLLAICTRAVTRQARREKKTIYLDSLEQMPAAQENDSMIRIQVEELLARMDAGTRMIAKMRLEMRDWPEIAMLLGYKDAEAARKRFQSGLKKLRATLGLQSSRGTRVARYDSAAGPNRKEE